MPNIHTIKMELVLSGPANNQLLSPLTPYIALCGADGPVTLYLPFEQRQLLHRLERLRYSLKGQAIANPQREAEVRDLGEILGRLFGAVPTLISELALARCTGGLIHLVLSMSALELGLVPFEFAIGADGFPASGSPLFLQNQSPIAITREVRRGKPLSVAWDTPPRILFAFADPVGAVPAEEHLRALRRAIDPWVKWKLNNNESVTEVKKLLTVLPNASLKSIAKACQKDHYTHVHILAHGQEYERAGEKQYGLALHGENSLSVDVVDGVRLAGELISNDSRGCIVHRPTVVTLATCDSGAVNSVLTPGGSLAHELHASGIPWVFASQFPLWFKSSIVAVERLYHGLLKGADPRWVVHELRQALYAYCNDTHDWASIVAYASLPDDFVQQVASFREKQRKTEIEVKFHIADQYIKNYQPGELDSRLLPDRFTSIEELIASIRAEHQEWLNELDVTTPAKLRAEVLGMYAAAEKRIGLIYEKLYEETKSDNANNAPATAKPGKTKAEIAYAEAQRLYKQAVNVDPSNHWALTQYLSLSALLDDGKDLSDLWITAKQLAAWCSEDNGETKAGALASLLELELLSSVYAPSGNAAEQKAREDKLINLCEALIATQVGDGFMLRSTRRQFKRYVEVDFWQKPEWVDLAQIVVAKLDEVLD